MRRALALLLTTFLAGCVVPTPPSVPSNAGTTTKDDPTLGGLCKVGPDGGPLLADRGIGGTGIGVSGTGGIGGTGEPMRLAERGIGGTGLRPDDLKGPTRGVRPTEILQPTEIAQRTTGIVGVITGFASICVDGLDIAVDHTVPIDIEGKPGDPNALRAGQVVAIEATGPTGALRAKGIAVRHEVAGPIERLEVGANTMIVAGQRVSVPNTAWGAGRFGLGDQVIVSGLRRPDGGILATRLDRGSADVVSVRGQVSTEGGTLRIGAMTLQAPVGMNLAAGQFVSVTGAYRNGALQVGKISNDVLAANPPAYFGPTVGKVLVQSIVRVEGGRVLLNGHVRLPASSALSARGGERGNAVLSLEKGTDGQFSATGLREVDGTTALPAPTPQPSIAPGASLKTNGTVPDAGSAAADAMQRAKSWVRTARSAGVTGTAATTSWTAPSVTPTAWVAAPSTTTPATTASAPTAPTTTAPVTTPGGSTTTPTTTTSTPVAPATVTPATTPASTGGSLGGSSGGTTATGVPMVGLTTTPIVSRLSSAVATTIFASGATRAAIVTTTPTTGGAGTPSVTTPGIGGGTTTGTATGTRNGGLGTRTTGR